MLPHRGPVAVPESFQRMNPAPDGLHLAHCAHCGCHTFPATAYGCRQCGRADRLSSVSLPQPPVLTNFVTLHAELAPGLPVPCVIGEVQLAPGVVEEALIAADEAQLVIGMPLRAEAVPGDGGPPRWHFVPIESGPPRTRVTPVEVLR